MLEEVRSGLYRVTLPTPGDRLDGINCYLFEGEAPLLVDTGFDTEASWRTLTAAFDSLGLTAGPEMVVTTHGHVDHAGQTGRLRAAYDATVAAHPADALYAARPDSKADRLDGLGTWFELNGATAEFLHTLQTQEALLPSLPEVQPAIDVDRRLVGGETITAGPYTLEVRWAPGHAPGHVCLYDADQDLLLTGDHVLPDTTPVISMHPYNSSDPLGDYVTSLSRTADLQTDQVLPSHGDPFAAVGTRATEILDHHRERMAEIEAVLDSTPATGWEIAHEISWSNREFESLGLENTALAVLETLAHIEHLRSSSPVSKRFENGRIEFLLEP